MPFLFWLPMILMGGMFMVAANGGAHLRQTGRARRPRLIENSSPQD
jgi:hypothetical protein